MTDPREEFYVGYQPDAPPALRGWLRGRVRILLAVVALLAAALTADMARFPAKVFEWGEQRTFEGWLQVDPAPSLLVRRPGRTDPGEVWSRYLLTRPGKFGAGPDAAEFDGNHVTLEGTLIYREDQAMIEVVPGTISPGGPRGRSPSRDFEELGTHTLVGEIVDSKCYLGVMAPGSTKPHRACATRCIEGGVPPVFLVRQENGRAVYLLLLAADGSAVNDRIASMIAEPLRITGSVERHVDLLVLKADPETYRRVS